MYRLSNSDKTGERVYLSLIDNFSEEDLVRLDDIATHLAHRCYLEGRRTNPGSLEASNTLRYRLTLSLQALQNRQKESLISLLQETPEGAEYARYLESLPLRVEKRKGCNRWV